MRRAAGSSAALSLTLIVLDGHSTRHIAFHKRIRKLTDSRLANAYQTRKIDSSQARGPRAAPGYDPVTTHFNFQTLTGPLKRKVSTDPDNFLNVDEAAKWMDAKQAAKVLGIKEEELPKLDKETLEEKWVEAYKTRSFAAQEEVVIATEVLLEYLDSTVHLKKSRLYYREFLQNARLSIDAELQAQKRLRNQSIIWIVTILVFGVSFAILFVAYARKYLTKEDATAIGVRATDYMVMTFMQPKNLEPKPDYNTRYFNTPTAMEIDKNAGRYEAQFASQEEIRLLQEREEYNRREEAEMLKMLNDENEKTHKGNLLSEAKDSRVLVLRPEDLIDDSGGAGASGKVGDEKVPRKESGTSFYNMSFSQFNEMVARNFGGGSRFQRITRETSQRAEEMRRLKAREEETS